MYTGEVLVTGGAGFIGRHVVEALSADGCRVTALDRCATPNSAFGADWLAERDVTVVRADVHDTVRLAGFVRGHEVIVHAASEVGVQETAAAPIPTIRHLDAAMTVAETATDGQSVVFLSSSDVYGMHSTVYDGAPMREDDLVVHEAPPVGRWTYARVKALSEVVIAGSRARTASLRIFNCYGPGLDFPVPRRVVPAFFLAARAGQPLRVNGDGSQRRAFCFVEDIVRGITATVALLRGSGGERHETINLGNPFEVRSIADIAGEVARLSVDRGLSPDGRPTIQFEQPVYTERFNDAWTRTPDISRARTLLRYAPTVDVATGLGRVAEFYAAHTQDL